MEKAYRPRINAQVFYCIFSMALAVAWGHLAPACALAAGSPWGAIVTGEQTEAERLATIDLQRYLAQVTGQLPSVLTVAEWGKAPVAAVVVGEPTANALLLDLPLDEKAVGSQGYALDEKTVNGVRLVRAAGRTPEGAVNAVYGLLRELGYGFYLGSEALPAALPEGLPEKSIVNQPQFKMRGVLPWYNFFNSPTAWDPVDHRAFADQLIRMGANFIGFHTYDGEPFAAIEQDGKMTWGARLLNTATPTWGTFPVETKDFAYGTSQFFTQKFFGAETTLAVADPDAAIRREQDVMREALDYAHRRGLHTCIGFEINGDPLKAEDRDIFIKRLNHVLDQYPAIDYLWIWEPESQGVQGYRPQYAAAPLPATLDPLSPLVNYGLAQREQYRRVVNNPTDLIPNLKDKESERVARAMEGARLEQFAQLAHRALGWRVKAPRLVVSGWGGDDRLLSAEYYDGLDKALPKDVVFASLDMIYPRERVDRIYNELPAGRERWPIPWLENDGDQWHPQPWVHVYEKMVRDAQAGGSQGMLAIHWRTRDVEESFAYLVEAAWRPGLTVADFFTGYARRCYGPALADRMGAIHDKLDALGYRWVGGGGQGECAAFTWGPGDPGKMKELAALRGEVAGLMGQPGLTPAARTRLVWMLDRMDWVLLYEQAQFAVGRAQELLKQAALARPAQPDKAKELARQALAEMERDSLAPALRAYARCVSTRGEYGVLATINTKAVVAWNKLHAEAEQSLGEKIPEAVPAWNVAETTGSRIIMPRFLGSVAAGEALTLEPIVLGGQPAWLYYRPLNGPVFGDKLFSQVPLTPVAGWVQRAIIPAEAMQQPGVEFYLSVGATPTGVPAKPAWGPVTVSVMPKLEVNTTPPAIAKIDATGEWRAVARAGAVAPVDLSWPDVPGADYYRVLRDGKPVAEPATAFFPDFPPAPAGQYVVEAIHAGQVVRRSEPVPFTLADQPLDAPTTLTLRANQGGVQLAWPAAGASAALTYKIELGKDTGNDVAYTTLTQVAALRVGGQTFHHQPAPGDWVYRVTPVSATGRDGRPATTRLHFPPAPSTTPAIDLPLTSQPAGATVTGAVSFGPEGARFDGGSSELPPQDAINLAPGLTLTFDFKADPIGGQDVPLLLCHGQWHGDGWFVQVLGGNLIVRVGMLDANGPRVEPGKWTRVRFVYDGERLRLALNGQWLPQGEGTLLTPFDTARALIFGQYETREPRYAFHGWLRNVRLVPDVLTDLSGDQPK